MLIDPVASWTDFFYNKFTNGDSDNLNHQKKQYELASELGISQQQLSDYKKLNTLIPGLQELIETGQLKATTLDWRVEHGKD